MFFELYHFLIRTTDDTFFLNFTGNVARKSGQVHIMDHVSTSERFLRMLGDCQQLFRDREDELIANVNSRERVINDQNKKLRELEEILEVKTREVTRLEKLADSNRPPSAEDYAREQKELADTRAFLLTVKDEEIRDLKKTNRELRDKFRPAMVYDCFREQKELADARAIQLIAKDEEIEKLKQTINQLKVMEDEQDVQLENIKRHASQLKKQVEEQLLEMCANEYIIDEFQETVNDQKLLVDSKEADIEREQKKVAQLERELRLKESELVNAKRDLEANEKELVAWKKLMDEVCPERVPFEKIPPILHSQFQVITVCHDIFYISDYFLASHF